MLSTQVKELLDLVISPKAYLTHQLKVKAQVSTGLPSAAGCLRHRICAKALQETHEKPTQQQDQSTMQ